MPNKPTREDMQLDSGIADDFDGVISEANFEINAQYAAKSGTQDPMLTLIVDAPDIEKPVEIRYACGAAKQWEIKENGGELVSGKNPDIRRFNQNSRAGELVDRIFELVGGSDKVKGQDFFINKGFFMTQAGFYTGLNFHWKRESKKTVSGESRDITMPCKYLGEVTVAGKPAAGAAGAADEALDAIVIEMSSGKTEREIKIAATKNPTLMAAKSYMTELASTPSRKLVQLEKDNKISKGPDGKYI